MMQMYHGHGAGITRHLAESIADLGGHRGTLCRWGDRGGGGGAMAAGSVVLVGRSRPGVTAISAVAASTAGWGLDGYFI
jgi:hypothetical protein